MLKLSDDEYLARFSELFSIVQSIPKYPGEHTQFPSTIVPCPLHILNIYTQCSKCATFWGFLLEFKYMTNHGS